LAVKIVRQPKKIALIGAPSSAAALLPGTEKAPVALRAAGLVERLQKAGYEVIDYGDCPPRLFADDDEHRRARNLPAIVAGLNDLKTHVEVATKTGALVLVLGGDCAQSIGVLAGTRRYYKHVNLLWMDRDADLNTPATTPSGRIDGMVVAHITGKGAPELVRFWSEPQLVREPDILLFGIDRLDPSEQELLRKIPLRQMLAVDIQSKGASAAAKDALTHLHADTREFVLHLDLDVITSDDLPAVNVPGSGGLTFEEVRSAFIQLAGHKNLLGFDVAQYNPGNDPDGVAAKKIVDLLVEALTARLDANTVGSEPAPAPGPEIADSPAAAEESASHLEAFAPPAPEELAGAAEALSPSSPEPEVSQPSKQEDARAADENALGATSSET